MHPRHPGRLRYWVHGIKPNRSKPIVKELSRHKSPDLLPHSLKAAVGTDSLRPGCAGPPPSGREAITFLSSSGSSPASLSSVPPSSDPSVPPSSVPSVSPFTYPPILPSLILGDPWEPRYLLPNHRDKRNPSQGDAVERRGGAAGSRAFPNADVCGKYAVIP